MLKRSAEEANAETNGERDSQIQRQSSESKDISSGEKKRRFSGSSSKYNYAMVCSSNVNISMEAHVMLLNNQLEVNSYGAGNTVKLPGPNNVPVHFDYKTPYKTMYNELVQQDEAFFKLNKVLGLLSRDRKVKTHAEQWQAIDTNKVAEFDIVVCFDANVFDTVVDDIQEREPVDQEPIHVVCLETKDDTKEASKAGRLALKLCQMFANSDDLDDEASEIVEKFEKQENRRLLYTTLYL